MGKNRAKTPLVSKEQVKVDLKLMRAKIGAYAVRRLRQGKAVVHVWRGSSPHNRYVQNVDENRGHGFLWHSDGWGDFPTPWNAFELVSESKDRIAGHWLHSDGGKPFKSTYVLKKEYRLK